MSNYESICDEAKEITGTYRMDEYGHPKHNFKDIADLWTGYLGREITPKDVAMMMTLFKIGREKGKHKRDNLVDAVGYLRCGAMLEGLE
jgi:hypothetical protein